jgi:hypothetical protein
MSKFQPTAGMYFYVILNPFTRTSVDLGGTVTAFKVEDRSYRGDLLYCMAGDDHCVLAERVYGGRNYGGPITLVRENCTFHPVGPEVLRSLLPHLTHEFSKAPSSEQEPS